MNVSLTPELNRWVEKKVKSGFYTSSSEIIREGLRLLIRQEEQKHWGVIVIDWYNFSRISSICIFSRIIKQLVLDI
ncbi:MAG: type II toxin-antitoxin system ParD family antitoxin [Candidatus Atribacteria bacterium]|nr:type II toxin-antitoxin system ParD family antitoxin [Candidatus Atribacteria bacterium]